jgi:hypothetical protein
MLPYIILTLFILMFCSIMQYRNIWVFKQCIEHRHLVDKLCTRKIIERTYSTQLQREYYNAVWDYNKMLRHFWIWSIDKMVNNYELYKEVEEEGKNKK